MKLSERLAQLAAEAEQEETKGKAGRERRGGDDRRKEEEPVARGRREREERRSPEDEEDGLHLKSAAARGEKAKPVADSEPSAPDATEQSEVQPEAETAAPEPAATQAVPAPDPHDYTRRQKKAELEALKTSVRASVLKEVGPRLSAGAVQEKELRSLLERHLSDALATSSVSVGPSDRGAFYDELIADMVGWGPLETLMDDSSITEIMCNAHDEVWVERNGVLDQTDLAFSSLSAYRQVIDRMLAIAGRRVDESSPMADGRLLDGSRVNAIIPPLVVGEPVLTIRRFPEQALTVEDLVKLESLSDPASSFLEACVRGKLNVLISGGTGTGKTTLLNVLSNFIPQKERVVTIEDAAELRLEQPHVVTLEARPANIEGAGQVTIRDLVRNALRMRPDRIVVGEVRGAEALDMLQAMNTGHEGSLTTVHANSARDALSRIETMVLFSGLELPLRAIREQIASALDLVIQLERRSDGRRVVSLIAEIQGREGDTITMQDIFKRSSGEPLVATGLRPSTAEKLKDRGVTLPGSLFRGAESNAAPKTRRRSSS